MIRKIVKKLLPKKLLRIVRSNILKKRYGYDKDEIETQFKKGSIILHISGIGKLFYQFRQWEKPFEELSKRTDVILVVRTYDMLRKVLNSNLQKTFNIAYKSSLNQLTSFYAEYKPTTILYVNNNVTNFQSLLYTKSYHVHLNHGESEKESMFSNQSKAYDFVLTVGERGIDRYRENLLNFDENKYISIGRPQLDFIENFSFEFDSYKKIILYAPTWEGFSESMHYSSVEKFGVNLVKTILESNQYTLIYRPHPNTGVRLDNIYKAHKEIEEMIHKHRDGHIITDINIISLFTVVDFAFFDNSSVMIDYLHFDKPANYIEIQKDTSLKYLTEAFNILQESDMEQLIDHINHNLFEDLAKEKRKKTKQYYLGSYAEMESTNKFCDFVINLSSKVL